MNLLIENLNEAAKRNGITAVTVDFRAVLGILEAVDRHCDVCVKECERKNREVHDLYDQAKADGMPTDGDISDSIEYMDSLEPKRSWIACTKWAACPHGKLSVAFVTSIANAIKAGMVVKEVG